MEHVSKIQEITHLTHDVVQLKIDKPQGMVYELGQAVDLSFNQPDWKETMSCFTFTSLEDENHLEFVIKTYPEHNRFTNKLLSAKPGDELLVQDPFGDIRYKGEGIFLAGGSGITPFLAILKQLEKENKIGNNKLIFANKTKEDIILEDYFNDILGANFINVLSGEEINGYEHGFITAELLKKHIDGNTKYFYLCGPKPMMAAMENHLTSLGISEDRIVKEGF